MLSEQVLLDSNDRKTYLACQCPPAAILCENRPCRFPSLPEETADVHHSRRLAGGGDRNVLVDGSGANAPDRWTHLQPKHERRDLVQLSEFVSNPGGPLLILTRWRRMRAHSALDLLRILDDCDERTDRSGGAPMRRAALVDFHQESGPGTLAGSNVDFLVVLRKSIGSVIVVGRCRFRGVFLSIRPERVRQRGAYQPSGPLSVRPTVRILG